MAKHQKSAGMSQREKMYLVLALCCVALLVTAAVSFLIVHGLDFSGGAASGDPAADATAAPLVADSSYNKDENTIDTQAYTSTILEESSDAGQSYIDETLFLGDSNTARMYRGGLSGTYCTYDNAIGSVGMSARSLASYACVQFQGYSGYKTMAQAVALMQPRRVILTFGTNDLSPDYSASSFAEAYAEGVQTIVDAYPSVDIIVNAIPPLGQQHSNQSLTQTQVDEYNKALVEMCQEHDWKFLNSAEALKDSSTGYAKSGYVLSSDGIHLTDDGMTALFQYIRTHSYITEDDRPALTDVPKHTGDKDVSSGTAATVTTGSSSSAAAQATAAPAADSGSPDWEDAGTSAAAPTATPQQEYTYWSEIVDPTCTEQGYTYYHCNEDSAKDYKSEYVAALGHDYQNGVCTRCGAVDPSFATPTPVPVVTAAPTETPAATEAPVVTPEPAASDTAAADSQPDWSTDSTTDSTAEN